MTELSNSLADLAEQVKERHGQFTAAKRTTAEKAIEVGQLLCRAKVLCKHGDWLPFLARSGVGERWARRLMQIARSELTSDTVADLGIRGTLDYLSSRRLPGADQCLIVGRARVDETDRSPVAIITASTEHPGYFEIAVYDPANDEGEELVRPVLGQPLEFDDGTVFQAVWKALDEVLPIPPSERAFKLVWQSDLEDDCAFLGAENVVPGSDEGMPTSYMRALAALKECERDFTPERFLTASAALEAVTRRMTMWPDDPRMFAVYNRIASDEALSSLAKLVGSRAIQQMTSGVSS